MTSHQHLRVDVQRIIRIGRTGDCEQDDLHYFLPNLPNLPGSESIFTFQWSSVADHVGSEVVPFVQGLHLIEKEYKLHSSNDFGFGSPSPARRMLEDLRYAGRLLLDQADSLTEWIRNNGGIYYAKS